MQSRLKKLLSAGRPAIGAQLRFGSPAIAELYGHGGFDWLVVDTEHAPQSPQSIMAQLMAIDNTPATPVVRVPKVDPEQILLALDLGAMGIVAAFVETAEQAAIGARACRYPPEGTRGYGQSRSAAYGFKATEYREQINEQVVFIPMIESARGVQNIDEILAVDGVDTYLLGPADLSMSLGTPLDFGSRAFRDAAAKLKDAARRAGKPPGAAIPGSHHDPQTLRAAIDAGVKAILQGGDQWHLGDVCKRVRQIRAELGC